MRAVLSLRLFRLLRTLRKVHAFSLIASTFFRLLPAATTLLKTVGLLMFVFACVGLHLFGGLITTDTSGILVPAELVEALAESDFGNLTRTRTLTLTLTLTLTRTRTLSP